MLTLHNASLLKAQCGIVGMNHTTHLDPSSSALRVSDALFISLEAQSQQTEITVISGSPKKLRKQSEKSSLGLLGHLRLAMGAPTRVHILVRTKPENVKKGSACLE
ncbi:hypothetical protein CDL15_Pgr023451 [Punica granatum]|uniref:Uncharacterized protein n=1 Tax=Punica granatum TaxID=22663 RepID=A0A218WWI0_PUNGR|nr:hypothetical protein CDL15_Pgr023451 [Punica granatum]